MKVLILAGGFATRLWPLSEHRAKPLFLLNGRTILGHIFDQIPNDAEVVLLTNKKFSADFLAELRYLGREQQTTIFCEDAFADGEKLGALRAVSLACQEYNVNEDVLVFAGDNLLPDLQVNQLIGNSDEARMAIREVETLHEARKFGVVQIADKKSADFFTVTDFAEKPHEPTSRWVSTGFMFIGRELLPILHDYAAKHPDALGGIFPELLRQNQSVSAIKVGGEWFDVGSFESYLAAHEALQVEKLCVGKKAVVKNNTLSGKVYIGDNCEVRNCTLHNVILYPGTKLENCIISQSVLDEGCDFEGLDLNHKLIRAGTKFVG